MDKIDLSILKKNPRLTSTLLLEVKPLAPLSMVTELPGSYYKTLKIPNKKMLCGLFENLLGWHIDLADRKKISKDIKQLRNKNLKQKKKQESNHSNENVVLYKDYTKGSTYMPLLMDYFKVKEAKPVISKAVFYDDLWSKAYSRTDAAKVHIGGTPNISYEIIARKNTIVDQNESKLNAFFKNQLGSFPMFYSSPTIREYVSVEGKYKILMNMDSELNEMLHCKVQTNNACYLGNSEGWVDLKLIEP